MEALIFIPQEAIGAVIGKQGSFLRALRDLGPSCVLVENGASEGATLKVEGDAAAVKVICDCVRDMLQRRCFSSRVSGGGGGAHTAQPLLFLSQTQASPGGSHMLTASPMIHRPAIGADFAAYPTRNDFAPAATLPAAHSQAGLRYHLSGQQGEWRVSRSTQFDAATAAPHRPAPDASWSEAEEEQYEKHPHSCCVDDQDPTGHPSGGGAQLRDAEVPGGAATQAPMPAEEPAPLRLRGALRPPPFQPAASGAAAADGSVWGFTAGDSAIAGGGGGLWPPSPTVSASSSVSRGRGNSVNTVVAPSRRRISTGGGGGSGATLTDFAGIAGALAEVEEAQRRHRSGASSMSESEAPGSGGGGSVLSTSLSLGPAPSGSSFGAPELYPAQQVCLVAGPSVSAPAYAQQVPPAQWQPAHLRAGATTWPPPSVEQPHSRSSLAPQQQSMPAPSYWPPPQQPPPQQQRLLEHAVYAPGGAEWPPPPYRGHEVGGAESAAPVHLQSGAAPTYYAVPFRTVEEPPPRYNRPPPAPEPLFGVPAAGPPPGHLYAPHLQQPWQQQQQLAPPARLPHSPPVYRDVGPGPTAAIAPSHSYAPPSHSYAPPSHSYAPPSHSYAPPPLQQQQRHHAPPQYYPPRPAAAGYTDPPAAAYPALGGPPMWAAGGHHDAPAAPPPPASFARFHCGACRTTWASEESHGPGPGQPQACRSCGAPVLAYERWVRS